MSALLEALSVRAWEPPFEFDVESTLASDLARQRLSHNRAALAEAQPELLAFAPPDPPPCEYLFARDQSLTLRLPDGRWLDDCTVPFRAAQRMVAPLRIAGVAAVVIAPSHPAQVRALLDRIEPHQSILVLWPDDTSLHLACCLADLAEAIRLQRLIVATGALWWGSLRKVLEDRPGLPVPVQLVRLATTPSSIMEQLQPDLDQLIAEASARQQSASEVASANRRPRPAQARRWLVVGASHRTLWAEAPAWIDQLASDVPPGLQLDRIDSSRAVESSQLRFMRAAIESDVVVTVDAARSDQPVPALESIPWITLATMRIPASRHALPFDRLVVADDASARAARGAGWDDRQIVVRSITAPVPLTGRAVGVLADVVAPSVPDSVDRYSSQRLVWDNLVSMLSSGRFVGATPRAMIEALADAQQVEISDLPSGLMTHHLSETTMALWVARVLLKHGIQPVLFGRGWDDHPDLKPFHDGFDPTRLPDVLARCATLIDVWPARSTHPARTSGRRLVKVWDRTEAAVVKDVRANDLLTHRVTSGAVMLDWRGLQDLARDCLKR
jgi:hypothetical protein